MNLLKLGEGTEEKSSSYICLLLYMKKSKKFLSFIFTKLKTIHFNVLGPEKIQATFFSLKEMRIERVTRLATYVEFYQCFLYK
jgi:hypothetical protein